MRTMYFVGVSTSSSSIMKIFPKWAAELGLKDAEIKGIDLPLHAPQEQYRKVVGQIKNDPQAMGALVTSHKIDLFKASQDMFDYIDPYAKTLGEVSSLSKSEGAFCAHAKDPISSGLALESFVPDNFWSKHGGEVLLLGAGGSALAMSLYFAQDRHGNNTPTKITIANRSTPRLESAKVHLAGIRINAEYHHSPEPHINDTLISNLPPHSLIVNATGLGKDAPGSPTTNAVDYPKNCLVWEINYRGNLIFMQQAKAQQTKKNLLIEDGWQYFIHGWTQVISQVFQIPIKNKLLTKLSNLALTD